MTEEWVNEHTHAVMKARAIINPEERKAKLDALEDERIYETLRCMAHQAERVKQMKGESRQIKDDLEEVIACQQQCKLRMAKEESEKEGMKKGAKFAIEIIKWGLGLLGIGGGVYGGYQYKENCELRDRHHEIQWHSHENNQHQGTR